MKDIVLLWRCKKCVGSALAAPPSPVPICRQCLSHMKVSVPLGDRAAIAPGEFEVRCIRPLRPIENPAWVAGSGEEVWVVRAVGYEGDGGELAGTVGQRAGIVEVGIRGGRRVELEWEGLPSPGLPSSTVLEPSRHAAALALARNLAE